MTHRQHNPAADAIVVWRLERTPGCGEVAVEPRRVGKLQKQL